MTRAIIFDLSEVLIAGLMGVEQALATRLSMNPETVLTALGSDFLYQLCRGELTEDQYLAGIIADQGWNIADLEIKPLIRENFRRRVSGMDEILKKLSDQYELFLLSDHAREWVEYIHGVHPFLDVFKRQFFSFELRQTKQEPSTFVNVLQHIRREPQECLFFDDSQRNITCAASVGVQGVCFENAEQLSQTLNRLGIL